MRNAPRVLSFHSHGFLNTNLTDDAWEIFDGVGGENGLEIRPLVNLDVTQMTQPEILSLEDAVVMPLRLKLFKISQKGCYCGTMRTAHILRREAPHRTIVAK